MFNETKYPSKKQSVQNKVDSQRVSLEKFNIFAAHKC